MSLLYRIALHVFKYKQLRLKSFVILVHTIQNGDYNKLCLICLYPSLHLAPLIWSCVEKESSRGRDAQTSLFPPASSLPQGPLSSCPLFKRKEEGLTLALYSIKSALSINSIHTALLQ